MEQLKVDLPPPDERQHDGGGLWTFGFEAACILFALVLIVTHIFSLSQHLDQWTWWWLLAVALAWPAADFLSGFVHWLADTWGSETFPVLGPRFIRPFRVHHDTPTSFLKCNFLDTNGDTCLVAIPILLSLLWLPEDTPWGATALTFGVSLCVFAIPTNQIHQWAHMSPPPRWVRYLQRLRLILSVEDHALHHTLPYESHYCITSGFCNRWLERLRFFRTLEWVVMSLTGIPARQEELRHRDERRHRSRSE